MLKKSSRRSAALIGFVSVVAAAIAVAGIATAAGPAGGSLPSSVTVSKDPCVLSGKKVSGTISVVTSGGPIEEIMKKVYFDPFAKKCGVKFKYSSPQSLAKVQAMVRAKRVTWDLTDQSSTDYWIGAKAGLWQPLPKGLFKGIRMAPGSVAKYGAWAGPYAYIFTWKQSSFPNGGPKTAADIFDTTKYPGARCLARSAAPALELAMLANGYDFRRKPYTIDIDAALAKLDQLKPSVKMWWTSGNQPIDGLRSGECVISQVFNGRVFGATNDGDKLGFTYGASLIDVSWYYLIKGGPNPWGSAALLRFILSPQQQARYANAFGYAGGALDATKYMTPAAKASLASNPKNIAASGGFVDSRWWLANRDRAERAFEAWVQK